MAIFVWVGNNQVMGGSATDLSGLTAAGTGPTLGDEKFVTTNNRWNVASNWRERIPAGQTGNTGGGGSGPAGSGYYYATATRWPGASGTNDVAVFQYLYGEDGSRGLSAYHHYPKSELLYGGVSGANNLWNDSVLSSTADVMIQVESSYFDHGITNFTAYGNHERYWTIADHIPFKRRRFGSDFRGRPVSGITQDGNLGLNLTVSTIEIDSSFSDMSWVEWGYAKTIDAPVMGAESTPCVETQVVLTGPDTVAKTKFEMYGQGDYKLYAQYMNRFIAYPVGGHPTNGNASSNSGVPNYDRMPKIELNTNVTSLCRIAGLHLGKFDYNGLYGSTLGVNRMELGNKWVHADKHYYNRGSYNLRAGVDDLRVYPSNIVDDEGRWFRDYYGVNPTSSYIQKRALVNIESYGVGTRTGLTMDKITMFNSNPFQGVTLETPTYGGSSAGWNNSVEYNCFHGESAATSTELLYNINMEGGIFWTRNIDGNLKITNGELNGHLATMNMSAPVGQDGSIEVSGMATGGYTGPGVFIIDPTARLIPPSGVRAAFRTPSGGSGDAELGSKAQVVPAFVRKQP